MSADAGPHRRRSSAPWRAVPPLWPPANEQARPIKEGGRGSADDAHLEANNNPERVYRWELAVCSQRALAIAVCHDAGTSALRFPFWLVYLSLAGRFHSEGALTDLAPPTNAASVSSQTFSLLPPGPPAGAPGSGGV